MGNHAGNFNIDNLKWLGGLLDSDGCISINKNNRKNKKIVYTPCIVISNSNPYIIESVHNILINNDINHHIKNNNKSCKNITITRPNIIDKFCRLMYDKILVKQTELKFIHQFCLNRIKNISDSGCNWKANYTENEIELANKLSRLNKLHYKECIEFGIFENIIDTDLLNLFSINWLAGFIDGDGCITINKIKRPNGNYQYQPMVHIVTGSPAAKNIISIYLDRYNIDYYLKKNLPGTKHKPNCVGKKFEFYIRSLNNCIIISNLIKNKLYGKKQRCLKLLEFCHSRLINKNKSYSNDEIELYKWIHNDIKDTSTTTSKTSFDEDIV